MSVTGSTQAWLELLENMLPELLHLIIDAWPSMHGTLTSNKEDITTEAFCSILRKNRTLRQLPFLVDTQWVELNPASGQKQGRLDITFRPTGLPGSPNEDIYFCLECKRLNFQSGKNKVTGAPEYVKEGMMRFVNKQYGRSVKHGCMLGYVLDGQIHRAVKNVERNVKSHYVVLRMNEPGSLKPSSVLTTTDRAKESYHYREDETSAFCIYHLFLEADKLIP
ncbi:MAG: hypothetical protein AAFR81_19295 [Chloroflexota bacterium]